MRKVQCILLLILIMTMLAACASQTPTQDAAETSANDEQQSETSEEATETQAEAKKIFFINPVKSSDYFVYIEAAARKAGEEAGYDITYVDGALDFDKIAQYIQQATALKYDMIIVCTDKSGKTAIEDATAAGIPVIQYDIDTGAETEALITSNNFDIGVMAGEYVVELLTTKNGSPSGNVVSVEFPSVPTMLLRADGFMSVLENYPDINVESVIPKSQSIEDGQKFMEDLLISKGPGTIDIVYGTAAGPALGALSALETANRNEVWVVGIDSEEGQLNALLDPDSNYYGTVAQDSFAIGIACIEAAKKVFENGELLGTITVPAILIRKDNAAQWVEEDTALKEEYEPYIN